MALDTCRQVEGLIVDNIGEESDIYLDVLGIKTAAFLFMVDYQAAEKMASKRLKLVEKMRGKDDPKVIDPLCDLAQALAHMGDRERAEKYFDRAIKLVSELARDQGFSEEAKKSEEAQTNTAGTRLEGASLCHLEYDLIERLSDCYVWQGKLADAAKLMPASMRTVHTCRVDIVVSIIEKINKHFEERARNLDLPQ
jgi:tetratricopeptide (TPR) repeat protein